MSFEPESEREIREGEIREIFRASRAEVERHVPPFAATIDAAFRRQAPAGQAPGRAWRVRIAVVAMLCLITATGAVLMRQDAARHWRARPATHAPLESWSSPTAFLLETPGRELLRETPRFESTLYSKGKLP